MKKEYYNDNPKKFEKLYQEMILRIRKIYGPSDFGIVLEKHIKNVYENAKQNNVCMIGY